MTKLSLPNSFFFFLLLQTITSPARANSSKNESVCLNPGVIIIKAPLVVIVTDELINKICYQTGDFNLCHHILVQFKGKTLFPKPLAKVMWHLKDHAKTTAKKIVRTCDAMKDQHRSYALVEVYRRCLTGYTNAMNLLAKAEKSIQQAKIKPVVELSRNAMSAVRSCDQGLGRQWHGAPDRISQENKKFFDLNGILLVVCGVLKKSVRVG